MIKDSEGCLKEIITSVLPDTEEFLVMSGYFYFSGYELIYKELADKKIRILCGMDTDNKTLELLASSKEKIQDQWFKETLANIQNTNDFNNTESINAVKSFVEKAKDGSLEIRFEPSGEMHAKTFIFNYKKDRTQGGITPGLALGGSSNFTLPGLTKKGSMEGNSIFRDKKEVEDHNWNFERLWGRATTELLGKKNI